MTTQIEDYDTVANHGLIKQVAEYYNDAIENVKFYKEVNSLSLQKMSVEHLHYWKMELHTLIFDGMNCSQRCA